MRDTDLMQLALGLIPPWMVKACAFDAKKRRLDIEIDFARGGRFHALNAAGPIVRCTIRPCRSGGIRLSQHQAFLHARVARIACPDCGVKQIAVPWARAGSGCTLLFEALVMTLVTAMPVRAAARLVKEHDTRLWRIVHHWVEAARARDDLATVKRVAIDETAARRGHDYVTLFVDIDQRRVLFVADGRDANTVAAFADDLEAHNGDASHIKEVCIDMSGAFIKGVGHNLTEAEITFDKFHAVKLVNDAVDKVRRAESRDRPELKRSRYLWLKNERRLSAEQSAASMRSPACISKPRAPTGSASPSRRSMSSHPTAGRTHPGSLEQLGHRLPRADEGCCTHVMRNRDGILRWFISKIANGLIEGINSLVQAAKAKARGYRSTRNLKAITYLIAGKLELKLPT